MAKLNAIPSCVWDENVYDSGLGDQAPNDEFKYEFYTRLGVLPVEKFPTSAEALSAGRERYGDSACVFKTARYWVVYRIN